MRSYKWLIFGVVAVLVTAIFSGCVGQQPVELEFSVAILCMDPYEEEEGVVQETTWLDDTTLEVKVYVAINCAEEVESGSYELVNDTIILRYTCPECDEDCVRCLCGYELTYTFTNLEQMDYQFQIERIL
ncbi:MAG: hypothetical protein HXS48_21680 [Theionarchaea archaeon]|nr:hypothetical protein [Theionarchaea archaeon]